MAGTDRKEDEMYENRTFEPHRGQYSPAELAMDREGVSYYDLHAAIAAGRRARAQAAAGLVSQAVAAIKGWFAGEGKAANA